MRCNNNFFRVSSKPSEQHNKIYIKNTNDKIVNTNATAEYM